jgi:hypothetical protein
VVELSHRAMAVHQGLEQSQDRFRTDPIALGEFRNLLLPFRRQRWHRDDPLYSACMAWSRPGSVWLRSLSMVAASGAMDVHADFL